MLSSFDKKKTYWGRNGRSTYSFFSQVNTVDKYFSVTSSLLQYKNIYKAYRWIGMNTYNAITLKRAAKLGCQSSSPNTGQEVNVMFYCAHFIFFCSCSSQLKISIHYRIPKQKSIIFQIYKSAQREHFWNSEHFCSLLHFGRIFKMSWWLWCWMKLKSHEIVHCSYGLVLKLWQEGAEAME